MVFPDKYLRFNKSLINLGAILIKNIERKLWYSVDELWKCIKIEADIKHYTFNDLILTLDFLFSINGISINNEGKICLN